MALQRAQGWLELHLPLEANAELEEIQPTLRAHPDVLKFLCTIYDAAKKWELMLEVAGAFTASCPMISLAGFMQQ